MLRKLCLLLTALLLGLLCGCRKGGGSAAEVSFSSSVTTEAAAFSETAAPPIPETVPGPETEALPETEDVPETEAVAETEPPRTFTDADFNFYLDGFGEPDPDRINVTFYPNAPDPNIRVWNSYQITNETEIRDICGRILASDFYDADRYGRTLDSMAVEWLAHNAVNSLYDNERTRHVDFNRADEGVTYAEFWQRAFREFSGNP